MSLPSTPEATTALGSLPFYVPPLDNVRSLVRQIDETGRLALDGSDVVALTRLVNRSTLELFRGWRWHDAHAVANQYLERLVSARDSGRRVPEEDIVTTTMNLSRLDAAVGDVARAARRLEPFATGLATSAVVYREAVNLAVLTGATREFTTLVDQAWRLDQRATGILARRHLRRLEDRPFTHRCSAPSQVPNDGTSLWLVEEAIVDGIQCRDDDAVRNGSR